MKTDGHLGRCHLKGRAAKAMPPTSSSPPSATTSDSSCPSYMRLLESAHDHHKMKISKQNVSKAFKPEGNFFRSSAPASWAPHGPSRATPYFAPPLTLAREASDDPRAKQPEHESDQRS
jgi:hypothetical protein